MSTKSTQIKSLPRLKKKKKKVYINKKAIQIKSPYR